MCVGATNRGQSDTFRPTISFGFLRRRSSSPTTHRAPAAAAALPGGDYDFNLPGLNSIAVHVEDCGFECIKLTTPNKFKVDLHVNRQGTRYEGVATDPHGAMCGQADAGRRVLHRQHRRHGRGGRSQGPALRTRPADRAADLRASSGGVIRAG